MVFTGSDYWTGFGVTYHYFQGVFPGGFIEWHLFHFFQDFDYFIIDWWVYKKSDDWLWAFWTMLIGSSSPLVFSGFGHHAFTLLIRRDFVAGIGRRSVPLLALWPILWNDVGRQLWKPVCTAFADSHLEFGTGSALLYPLGLGCLGISKISKSVAQYRGLISLDFTVLFLFSFWLCLSEPSARLSNIYFQVWPMSFLSFLLGQC